MFSEGKRKDLLSSSAHVWNSLLKNATQAPFFHQQVKTLVFKPDFVHFFLAGAVIIFNLFQQVVSFITSALALIW